MGALLLIIGLLAAGSATQASSLPKVRGLNPELAQHYAGTSGKFTCLDGSKAIPFSQVNDDYCDCADGSDEPGTAACHNGVFYCKNTGHEPRLLQASFVDDGICDCCDGTDERSGCANTCLEKNAEKRNALKSAIDDMKAALKKQTEFKAKAKAKRQDMARRSAAIDKDIDEQQVLIAKLQADKARLEEAEKKAAEERRVKEEAEAAARAAAEAAGSAAAGTGSPPASEAAGQEAQSPDEAAFVDVGDPEWKSVIEDDDHKFDDDEFDGHGAGDDAAGGEAAGGGVAQAEETDEERGRRIASQWTSDPEAAGVKQQQQAGHDDHVEQGDDDDDDAHAGQDDYGNYKTHEEEEYNEEAEGAAAAPAHTPEPVAGEPTTSWQAQSQLSQAETKLGKLREEKERLGRYATYDFGPDDLFLPMAEQCFEDHGRFIYQMCWFEKAEQRESYSNRVSLGSWSAFEDNYSTLVFGPGAPCANAPPRSFRVSLVCGVEEKLTDSSEPSTCVYTAKLSTPLVCTAKDLADAEAQLRQLMEWEAKVKLEIAAEKASAARSGHDEL